MAEEKRNRPNALRIWPLGHFETIYIEDFTSGESLGAPINCDRINAVSTAKIRLLSAALGVSLIGYVDSHGQSKELVNNSVMSTLSGYSYLPGGCILCAWNGDYAPLDPDDAERICRALNDVIDTSIYN